MVRGWHISFRFFYLCKLLNFFYHVLTVPTYSNFKKFKVNESNAFCDIAYSSVIVK